MLRYEVINLREPARKLHKPSQRCGLRKVAPIEANVAQTPPMLREPAPKLRKPPRTWLIPKIAPYEVNL